MQILAIGEIPTPRIPIPFLKRKCLGEPKRTIKDIKKISFISSHEKYISEAFKNLSVIPTF